MYERRIALEGAKNFRDFGGYEAAGGKRVKWRRLFRSDRLSLLTDTDFATIDKLGLKLVCDLRRGSELTHAPTIWPGSAAPEIFHTPLFVDEETSTVTRVITSDEARTNPKLAREIMIDLYRRLVTTPSVLVRYKTLFERIFALEGAPVLIHCSGGKDRTGIICALILGLFGVARETIIKDFMMSRRDNDEIDDLVKMASQIFDFDAAGKWTLDALRPVFTVERAYIETALALIDNKYGSAENFLAQGVGLPKPALDRFAKSLVE